MEETTTTYWFIGGIVAWIVLCVLILWRKYHVFDKEEKIIQEIYRDRLFAEIKESEDNLFMS